MSSKKKVGARRAAGARQDDAKTLQYPLAKGPEFDRIILIGVLL